MNVELVEGYESLCATHTCVFSNLGSWLSKLVVKSLVVCTGCKFSKYLLQDNCSVHTAKIIDNWFANNKDVTRLVAPANSPDLNLIQNVWAETTRDWFSVFPRNLETLNPHVTQNWEELRNRPDYFQSLYDSMPARINAVIDNNGRWFYSSKVFNVCETKNKQNNLETTVTCEKNILKQ